MEHCRTIARKEQLALFYKTKTSRATFNQGIRELKSGIPKVRFTREPIFSTFDTAKDATMRIYDSGANRYYFSESDRKKLGLHIEIILVITMMDQEGFR